MITFQKMWQRKHPAQNFYKDCLNHFCPDDVKPKYKKEIEEFCKSSRENCEECWKLKPGEFRKDFTPSSIKEVLNEEE